MLIQGMSMLPVSNAMVAAALVARRDQGAGVRTHRMSESPRASQTDSCQDCQWMQP